MKKLLFGGQSPEISSKIEQLIFVSRLLGYEMLVETPYIFRLVEKHQSEIKFYFIVYDDKDNGYSRMKLCIIGEELVQKLPKDLNPHNRRTGVILEKRNNDAIIETINTLIGII